MTKLQVNTPLQYLGAVIRNFTTEPHKTNLATDSIQDQGFDLKLKVIISV